MLNTVALIGRLTSDPTLKTTQSGKSVVEFSIAVNKRFKPTDGSADADFFRVKAWGQTAKFVGDYITKGRLVAVSGRIETRKWTASDGTNRESVEIVADNVNALDRVRDDAPAQPTQTARTYSPPEDEFDPFAESEYE